MVVVLVLVVVVGGGGGVILGEVKARPKDIISFSLDYISKSKVQTSNPSSSPTPLDTPARPADLISEIDVKFICISFQKLLSKHFVFNFVFNLLLISVFCFSLLVIPLVIPCFSLFVGPIRWGKGVECILSQAKDQSDQQVSCPTVTLIQTIETLLMEFGWKTWWKLHVFICFYHVSVCSLWFASHMWQNCMPCTYGLHKICCAINRNIVSKAK